MKFQALIHSKFTRSFVSALAGFLAYGGWAYFVNLDHGARVGIKAGLTQGTYSFVLTLILAVIMESIFLRFKKSKAQFRITFIFTCLMLYSSAWTINMLLGTPEILLTILPGSIIGTIYTFTYTLALAKLQQINTS